MDGRPPRRRRGCPSSTSGSLEAILFAAQSPIEERGARPAHARGRRYSDRAEDPVRALRRARRAELQRSGNAWSFRTAPDLAVRLGPGAEAPKKLSRAALEVLAVIAYHQPVTRSEIEEVRGVSLSKGTLELLLEAGWIRLRGRRRTPGRPVTFGTTTGFLDHFGLESLGDLPDVEELKAAGLLDQRVAARLRPAGPRRGPGRGSDRGGGHLVSDEPLDAGDPMAAAGRRRRSMAACRDGVRLRSCGRAPAERGRAGAVISGERRLRQGRARLWRRAVAAGHKLLASGQGRSSPCSGRSGCREDHAARASPPASSSRPPAPSASTAAWSPVPAVFLPAERRGVGLMFQDYALFPHMTEPRQCHVRPAPAGQHEAARDARSALERVGLGRYADAASGRAVGRRAAARRARPRHSAAAARAADGRAVLRPRPAAARRACARRRSACCARRMRRASSSPTIPRRRCAWPTASC